MFWATNKTTNKKVSSLQVGIDGSYLNPEKDIWYADADEIERYDKDKVKNINEIIVKYREGSEDVINWKGTRYAISPHFFIPNKTHLGINTIPESREHKLAKNWIYNRIKNNKLELYYAKTNKPTNELYFFNPDLLNLSKIGIEINVKDNKTQRADILLPLKKYSELFGNGIVIEIQFSKQYESTELKRTVDWAIKGFSVCWLHRNQFDEINNSLIDLKDKYIEFKTVGNILKNLYVSLHEDMRTNCQRYSRLIDEKLAEAYRVFSTPDVLGECPDCRKGTLILREGKFGKFYGCSYYPLCKKVIKIDRN